MSQAYLAEYNGSTNWGDRKSNQIKSTQINSTVGFWREGKTRVSGEKPFGAEKRTNKLNPHMTPLIPESIPRAILVEGKYSYQCANTAPLD